MIPPLGRRLPKCHWPTYPFQSVGGPRAGESETEGPAGEISTELVLDVARDGPLAGREILEPALEELRHGLVERRLFGATPLVTAGRRGPAMWAEAAIARETL